MAPTVTSLQLFAFVILPVAVAASAWGVVVVAERRGAAKAVPHCKASRSPD